MSPKSTQSTGQRVNDPIAVRSGTVAMPPFPGANRARHSLCLKLLVAVNSILGTLLLVLLSLNYCREFAHAVAHERAELREEAISIFEAVRHLGEAEGSQSIQDYVDRVADRMRRGPRIGAIHLIVRPKQDF